MSSFLQLSTYALKRTTIAGETSLVHSPCSFEATKWRTNNAYRAIGRELMQIFIEYFSHITFTITLNKQKEGFIKSAIVVAFELCYDIEG
jgi:hypothetical protein